MAVTVPEAHRKHPLAGINTMTSRSINLTYPHTMPGLPRMVSPASSRIPITPTSTINRKQLEYDDSLSARHIAIQFVLEQPEEPGGKS
jgi:hypothetical protein